MLLRPLRSRFEAKIWKRVPFPSPCAAYGCREEVRGERRDKKDKKKHKKSKGSSSSSSSSRKRERSSDGRRSSPSPRGHRSDDEIDRHRRRDGRRDDDDGGRGRRDDLPAKKCRRDDGDNERGRYSNGNAGNGGQQSGPPAWLRPNIRVRVIHKSYGGGRAYLGKGRVVDVPRVGQATVRMDLGELVLEGDAYKHRPCEVFLVVLDDLSSQG